MGLFSGPDFGGMIDEVAKQTQNPAFAPKTGAYPQGSSTTSGGGGINFNINRSANFSNRPGLLKKISGGGFKNLSSQQRAQILANPGSVDFTGLPQFLKNKYKAKGGKVKVTPQINWNPEPESSDLFNFLRDAENERVRKQDEFNTTYLEPLVGRLANLQGGAIDYGNTLLERGFTDLDPAQEAEIDSMQKAYIDKNKASIDDDFESALELANEIMAENGTPIGRSSMGGTYLKKVAFDPYAKARTNLENDSNLFRETLRQNRLADSRAAYGTAMASSGFNRALEGLEMPNISYDRSFTNPTGQWSPELMAQMLQFANQFGLQKDQLRQQPLIAGIPSAMAAASQPGGLSSIIGSIMGGAGGTAANLGIIKAIAPGLLV